MTRNRTQARCDNRVQDQSACVHANDLCSGVSDIEQVAANHFADAVANEGAARNAVAPDLASIISWVDARVYLVQKRLIKVGLHVARKAKVLYGSCRVPRDTAAANAARKRDELAAALARTAHSIGRGADNLPAFWQCDICLTQPGKAASRLEWLGTCCAGIPACIHFSHRPNIRRLFGVWYCDGCGLYAVKRFINLKERCAGTPASHRTKTALDRLRRQEMPRGMFHWPVPPAATLVVE